MRSLGNLKNNRDASTALIAVVIVAVLAVAAVGVYVFVLSDDEDEKGKEKEREQRTVIQGSMGIGTTFDFEHGGATEYPKVTSGKITIIGQNEDHYLLGCEFSLTNYEGASSNKGSFPIMMHKENGSIDFAKKTGISTIAGADKWVMTLYTREFIGGATPGVDVGNEQNITVESGVLNGKPIVHSFTYKSSYVTFTAKYKADTMDLKAPVAYTPSKDLWKDTSYSIKSTSVADGDSDETFEGVYVAETPDGLIIMITTEVKKASEKSWTRGIMPSDKFLDLEKETFTKGGTEKLDTIKGKIDVTVYTRTKTSGDNTTFSKMYLVGETLYKANTEERNAAGNVIFSNEVILTNAF